MFLDRIQLTVEGGRGGNGCDSFQHRTDRKLVPNGGDGGDGGNVIFRATVSAPSLIQLKLKQHLTAEAGGHGGNSRKRGRNGDDLVILVPLGTKIYDAQNNFLIRDLQTESEEVIASRGGKGGSGNQGGRKGKHGEAGALLEVELNFQLYADVFWIGLPNSGKSTLINRIASTKLKESDYPFTTERPERLSYQLSDYEEISFCEMPSLYDASYEGRGRGIDFLRHLENAKFIFYVVESLPAFAKDPLDGLRILREQVGHFQKEFLEIPFGVIVNKIEMADETASLENKIQIKYPEAPVFLVSAITGEGLKPLQKFLRKLYEQFRDEKST